MSYTPEGAVCISFHDLKNSPLSLHNSIETAFGSHPEALGIIIVKDLPSDYLAKRESLLKLANQFASLDESVRNRYVDIRSRYSFGWSHGKEIMNGRPDTLKGSYYANPLMDHPDVPESERQAYPEYYGNNIWPEKDEERILGFEEAFKALGEFIYSVGRSLAVACQPFASGYLADQRLSLSDLISKQTTKARLLHYFPPTPGDLPSGEESVDSWCGFHLDHSLLTGLCSAIFLLHEPNQPPKVVNPPSPDSGLYIRNRGGQLTKVSIPAECLAFQTGEALELATDGKLRATPHCVRFGSFASTQHISRETFALFMQPETYQQLSPSETFGQFSKRVFDEHYQEGKTMV